MTLRRRRAGHSAGAGGLHSALLAAHAEQLNGCLAVEDPATGHTARVYVHLGGVYAVELQGYPMPVGRRLLAAGLITQEQFASLQPTAGRMSDEAAMGRIAVLQEWVSVDDLGRLHQEFVLAAMGVLMDVPGLVVESLDGPGTSNACTVPIALDALTAAITFRDSRRLEDWTRVTSLGTPATTAMHATGQELPQALDLAETRALLAATDGEVTLDESAYAAGLTRTEAVHLAAALVMAGTLEAGHQTSALPWRLNVPEAFGEQLSAEPVSGDDVSPVEPAPDPVSDPEPEPEPEPAPVLEPGPASVPEPEPDVVAEESAATVALEPVPLDDFAIAALVGELAAAEHWVAEIRERLARVQPPRSMIDE